jgi:hypothetical protein
VTAKTWLETAVERFGQPFIAFPEPVIRPWMNRRCWALGVDGQNFHVAIDVEGDRVHTSAGSPGRRAELYGTADPTDDELRALCEYAWPGYRLTKAVPPC